MKATNVEESLKLKFREKFKQDGFKSESEVIKLLVKQYVEGKIKLLK